MAIRELYFKLEVLTGVHNRRRPEGETVAVSKITFHPDWNPYVDARRQIKTKPDIAILTLKHSVTFSDKVRPLCLPADATLSYAGVPATTAGWGNDGNFNKGRSPAKLKKIHTEVISGDHCRQLTSNKGNSMKWILE